MTLPGHPSQAEQSQMTRNRSPRSLLFEAFLPRPPPGQPFYLFRKRFSGRRARAEVETRCRDGILMFHNCFVFGFSLHFVLVLLCVSAVVRGREETSRQ